MFKIFSLVFVCTVLASNLPTPLDVKGVLMCSEIFDYEVELFESDVFSADDLCGTSGKHRSVGTNATFSFKTSYEAALNEAYFKLYFLISHNCESSVTKNYYLDLGNYDIKHNTHYIRQIIDLTKQY